MAACDVTSSVTVDSAPDELPVAACDVTSSVMVDGAPDELPVAACDVTSSVTVDDGPEDRSTQKTVIICQQVQTEDCKQSGI